MPNTFSSAGFTSTLNEYEQDFYDEDHEPDMGICNYERQLSNGRTICKQDNEELDPSDCLTCAYFVPARGDVPAREHSSFFKTPIPKKQKSAEEIMKELMNENPDFMEII